MKSITYIITFMAMLLFVGCEKDSALCDGALSTPSQGNFISVTTLATRSSDSFDTSKNFYLYIDQTGEDYDYFVVMDYQNGEWLASDPNTSELVEMTMIDTKEDINISALYCCDKSLTKDEYTSSQTEYNEGTDLLYANINEGSTLTINDEGVVTIDFKHILSSLCVTITTSENIIGATVSGIKPTLTWAASAGASAVTATGDTATESNIVSGEAIYIPRQIADKLQVKISLNSGNYIDTRGDVQFISTQCVDMNIVAGEQN